MLKRKNWQNERPAAASSLRKKTQSQKVPQGAAMETEHTTPYRTNTRSSASEQRSRGRQMANTFGKHWVLPPPGTLNQDPHLEDRSKRSMIHDRSAPCEDEPNGPRCSTGKGARASARPIPVPSVRPPPSAAPGEAGLGHAKERVWHLGLRERGRAV